MCLQIGMKALTVFLHVVNGDAVNVEKGHMARRKIGQHHLFGHFQ